MNETEQLALETIPTGGPKEVLTEQATNDPEIPEGISVEPSPNPEETVETVVDETEDLFPEEELVPEYVSEDNDNPLADLGGVTSGYNEESETFELINPEADFSELPLFANSFFEGEPTPGMVNLAKNMGMPVGKLLKYLSDNAEDIPFFGDIVKAHNLQRRKREELQDSITRITDDKTLTPEERQAKLAKIVEEEGVTYGDDLNLIYLDGKEDINAITKEVFEDPQLNEGMIGNWRVLGTKDGKVDPKNRKIPEDAGIEEVIAYIAKRYEGVIKSESGGVDNLNHQLMSQIADLTLLTDKKALQRILANKPGEIPPMPYILAMRDLYNIEARRLSSYIDDLNVPGGDSAEAVLKAREQFEIVANLQLKISGIKTNLARGLSSLRRESGFGPDGQIVQTRGRPDTWQYKKSEMEDPKVDPKTIDQQNLLNQLDAVGGKENLINFFKQWQSLPEKHRYGFQKKFYQYSKEGKLPQFFEKANEFWINALLSSPVTHARNLIGNSLMLFKHASEKYAIGAVNSTLDMVGINTGGVKFDEAHASAGAMFMALVESLSASYKVVTKGDKPGQLNQSSKFDTNVRPRQWSAESFGYNAPESALDPNAPLIAHMFHRLGQTINFPTGMLQAEDTFFKVLAQRYDITLQAHRSAKGKGLSGDDYTNYVAEFVTDPPEDALLKSQKTADYLTFQEELGQTAKSAQKFIQSTPGRWFLPFFKTPFNIAKVTFKDGSPLGLFSSEVRRKIKSGTPEEREEALARMATGSLMIFGSMWFADSQFTTDDGQVVDRFTAGNLKSEWRDSDKRVLRNIDRRQNRPEYSIAVVNDDGKVEYVPIRGMEPFSSWIMIGLDLRKIMNNPEIYSDNEDAVTKVLISATMAMQNALINKTFATGADQFFKVAFEPERYGKDWFKQMMLGFVPNALKQMGKINDPVLRQTMTLLEDLKKGIPFMRSSLNPYMDLHGNELEEWQSGGESFWNPIASKEFKPERLTNLQKEWQMLGAGPNLPKPYFSYEGVNIDLREMEKGPEIYHELQLAFAKDYNIHIEKWMRGNSASAKYYRRNVNRFKESNGQDLEARDRAVSIVNDLVQKRRKGVIKMYIGAFAKNYKHGFDLQQHYIDEKKKQFNLNRKYK